jgi:hypothetical protein
LGFLDFWIKQSSTQHIHSTKDCNKHMKIACRFGFADDDSGSSSLIKKKIALSTEDGTRGLPILP